MNFNDTKINNTNGFAIDYAFSDFSECQFCKKTVSKYYLETKTAIDVKKDRSHNFTTMLGYDNQQFTELMRLYLTIHR